MPIVETHHLDLEKLFSDDFQFEIPSYQRPYSWGTRQANDLLDDIGDAVNAQDEHFLGALLLVKGPRDEAYSVLDGQQRLTTLTILFAVLRDLAGDPEAREAFGERVMQRGNRLARRAARPRLTPRESQRTFFLDNVQTPGATAELAACAGEGDGPQDRMREVARTFRERLALLDEEARDALGAFLIQECFVVAMVAQDRRSARRLFRVLNDRGVDLSDVDILKARFLDGASDGFVEDAATRWEIVENGLGGRRFADLFRFLVESRGQSLPADDLETVVPNAFGSFKNPPEFLSRVLEPAAELMSFAGDRGKALFFLGPDGADNLRCLSRLGLEGWFPALLARFLNLPRSSWDEQAGFLALLERTAYSLTVGGATKAMARERYAAMCIASVARCEPEDLSEAEKTRFLDRLRDKVYGTPYCLPVLLKLDGLLNGSGAVYEDPTTIEHVLPQTVAAGSEWEKAFPDPLKRARWCNQLGNLVFLTRAANAQAHNHGFAQKKAVYVNERNGVQLYALTMDVFRLDAWDLRAFEERQARLVSLLGAAWGLTAAAPIPQLQTAGAARWTLAVDGQEIATAHEQDGFFVVRAGSACLTRTGVARLRSSRSRTALQADRTLTPDASGRLVFSRDWSSVSAAQAAAVVLDMIRTGAREWREIGSGRTYEEVNAKPKARRSRRAEPVAA